MGCIENRFVYLGKPEHELNQLYQCDFVDPDFYQLRTVPGKEGDQAFDAIWVDIDRFKSGELHLVPEECLAYL